MPMPRTYSDTQLRDAIATSVTWSEVGRKLGKEGRARSARPRADLLQIDYSHFVGQAWHKGKRSRPDVRTVLKSSSPFIKGLRDWLIEDGVKERKCEECNNTEWNGVNIPLEIDHIDGDTSNNLLSNLRILCCNCHALTPTWRRRKPKPVW